MPMLFAKNLNNIALSAIRKAEVYANAVSSTPGPVSVSEICEHLTHPFESASFLLTVRLYVDLEFDAFVK
jgi:hypothetical protein